MAKTKSTAAVAEEVATEATPEVQEQAPIKWNLGPDEFQGYSSRVFPVDTPAQEVTQVEPIEPPIVN